MLKSVIVLIGGLICLAALVMFAAPQKFRNLMNGFPSEPRFLFAVIVRIIIGAILLLEAANLRFTLVVQIIGAIGILAAVVLLLMGRERMDRFIDWFMSKMTDKAMRAWSIFAFAFGGFLIYVAT